MQNMAPFRVTQEFALLGGPLTQPDVDRLLGRLREAAPGASAGLELGIGRMRVVLTVPARDAAEAVGLATGLARSAIGRRAAWVGVEPAGPA